MRKKIKKPATYKAKDLIIKKLNKLAETETERIKIIEQSTINCWQDIYPLKTDNQNGTGKNANGSGKISESGKPDKIGGILTTEVKRFFGLDDNGNPI
jgi:hypothetical protein